MKMCSRCSLKQLCSSQWIDSNIKCTIFGGEKCFLKEAYQTQATKRKQVPFSCETLITAKWKELDVFALVMRALSCWRVLCLSRAQASKHTAFHLGLSLDRFEPLAPTSQAGVRTVPWGCALGKGACHRPAEGSDATSREIREEVGKAGSTHSLAIGSLLPAQFPLWCPFWGQRNVEVTYVTRHGGGSRVCPIPGRGSRAGEHGQTCVSWAPAVQSSWPSGGDGMQLARFGSVPCWQGGLNQGWSRAAWICLTVFLTESLCALSCIAVLFKDVNLKKKKNEKPRTPKPNKNQQTKLETWNKWDLLWMFYKSSICK